MTRLLGEDIRGLGSPADDEWVSQAEQVRIESTRRRKIGIMTSAPIALASFAIAALHIGLFGATVTFVVTPAALLCVLWFVLRGDRARRARRLPAGVLATTGASVRVAA
jgi:hypothetical protein